MKSAFLCLILVLTTSQVFAAGQSRKDLKRQISAAMQNIHGEINYDDASDDQLREVLNKLNQALGILSSDGGGDLQSRLTCVSRDNDGREPYQIARENPDFTTTKIPGTVLSAADCKTVIGSIRQIRGYDMLCVARDNDARGPFQILAAPKNGGKEVRIASVDSLQSCLDNISHIQVNKQFLAICAARDNDGRSPWVRTVLDLSNGSVKTTGESYGTLQQCWQ